MYVETDEIQMKFIEIIARVLQWVIMPFDTIALRDLRLFLIHYGYGIQFLSRIIFLFRIIWDDRCSFTFSFLLSGTTTIAKHDIYELNIAIHLSPAPTCTTILSWLTLGEQVSFLIWFAAIFFFYLSFWRAADMNTQITSSIWWCPVYMLMMLENVFKGHCTYYYDT